MDRHQSDNESAPELRCPKCGQVSESEEICDACGVVISKVREREALTIMKEMQGETQTAPAGKSSRTGAIVRISLAVLAFACIGFIYLVRSGNLEKITQPKRDLPEEFEVPEGFRGVVLAFLSKSGPASLGQAAIITELGREYRGKLAFVRLDMKDDSVMVQRLGVGDQPTVFFYNRRGRLKAKLPATAPKQMLKDTIERYL
jgi:hypothetical protein